MRFFLSLTLFFTCSLLFSQVDLPPNPQPGRCYVKCYSEIKEFGDWKQVDCDFVSFNELPIAFNKSGDALLESDKKAILKDMKKVIKKKYSFQISSHYHSKFPDSINTKLSEQRGILVGNFLVESGVDPKYIYLNAKGNSEPLKRNKFTEGTSGYFAENTRIEFRVINTTNVKAGKWVYMPEYNMYCLKKTDSINN